MILKERRQKIKFEKMIKRGISYVMALSLLFGLCGVFTPIRAKAEGTTNVLSWVEHKDEADDFLGTYGGPFSAAIRFNEEDLKSYDGRLLSKVAVYFRDNPESVMVKICTGGSCDNPGNVVTSQVYKGDLTGNGWREIELETPVEIDATKDLWIVVEYGVNDGFPGGVVSDDIHSGKGDLGNAGKGWISVPLGYAWMIEGILKDKDIQTITASNITLTYDQTAGSVGATTNGDGILSYEVKSGNSVSVDATSGELTINSAGDTVITIKASSTKNYKEATKDITVSVEKGSQTIFSPNELTLKVGTTPSAIGATTNGDGALSYEVTSGDAVTVDANGNITPVAVGNATVTVTVAATNNYKEVTKEISVTVSEKNPQVIEANDISLKVDEKGTLNATLSKGDGTLRFDVFGDSINFNDSTGEIEAIKEGTSKIVITASETEDFAETVKTVTITVTKKDEPANPENLEPNPNEPSDPGDEDLTDPEIPDKDWLDDLRLALRIADELGGERTVEYSGDFALSYDIMKYLEEHPLITLIYHVTYEDVEYTITIPAGKAIADPEIPWYGPLWLLANYGGKTPNATR